MGSLRANKKGSVEQDYGGKRGSESVARPGRCTPKVQVRPRAPSLLSNDGREGELPELPSRCARPKGPRERESPPYTARHRHPYLLSAEDLESG